MFGTVSIQKTGYVIYSSYSISFPLLEQNKSLQQYTSCLLYNIYSRYTKYLHVYAVT